MLSRGCCNRIYTLYARSTSFFSAKKRKHHLVQDNRENCAVFNRNAHKVPNGQKVQCNGRFEDPPVVPPAVADGAAVNCDGEEIVNNPADNRDEEAGPREPRYAIPNNARAPRPMKRK